MQYTDDPFAFPDAQSAAKNRGTNKVNRRPDHPELLLPSQQLHILHQAADGGEIFISFMLVFIFRHNNDQIGRNFGQLFSHHFF